MTDVQQFINLALDIIAFAASAINTGMIVPADPSHSIPLDVLTVVQNVLCYILPFFGYPLYLG